MIFTRYSLQFERALKNLTPNTERATKKQNAFWAGFRKKEESYYFFPDPVILINNEPSLSFNQQSWPLKGHSQLWDRSDLDTTFVSLKSVYLNPKSNVRIGYI